MSESFESYITDLTQYENEFKTNYQEMLIAGLVSSSVGYYMGDDVSTALKRGGLQSLAQYIGGFIADALKSGGYVNGTSSLLAYKVVISAGSFAVASKQLGSQLDWLNLLGESSTATIVGYYGQQYIGNMNTPSNPSNPSNPSSSPSNGTPTY